MPKIEILTPTDFSVPAENAYLYARMIASLLDARLDVVHVFSVLSGNAFQPLDVLKVHEEEARQRVKTQMDEYTNRLAATSSYSVKDEHRMVCMGIAFEEILKLAESVPYALIVMGTKGTNNLDAKIFGTNTSTLLSNSPIPVVVVPERFALVETKTILVALEPGEADIQQMGLLRTIADATGARVVLMSVDKGGHEAGYRTFLEGARVQFGYANTDIAVVKADRIMAGIQNASSEYAADLLVMVQHRRTLLERFFNASLTEKVVGHPTVPVLVFRQ